MNVGFNFILRERGIPVVCMFFLFRKDFEIWFTTFTKFTRRVKLGVKNSNLEKIWVSFPNLFRPPQRANSLIYIYIYIYIIYIYIYITLFVNLCTPPPAGGGGGGGGVTEGGPLNFKFSNFLLNLAWQRIAGPNFVAGKVIDDRETRH